MLNENLEDTHLCIKCRATIVGLDQYVQHRKMNCEKNVPISEEQPIAVDCEQETHTPYEPYNFDEGAIREVTDVDFDAYVGHDSKVGVSSKEIDPPPSQGYDDPYDHGLGADIFFTSLRLQSSSKKSSIPSKNLGNRIMTRKTKAAVLANSDFDWADSGHEKLLKAVSEISGSKKDATLFDLNYFNHESPDLSEIDEDDDDDEPYEYYNAPPQTHTGGKWKPDDRPTVIRKWNEQDHWVDDHGFKEPDRLDKSFEDDDIIPPPSHTKGKWIPGTKIVKLNYKAEDEKNQTEFRCNVCNKTLSSRIVYERHIKSNLHQKHLQTEFDDDTLTLMKSRKSFSNRLRQKRITATAVSGDLKKLENEASAKKTRQKKFIRCEPCGKRLPINNYGKHLISQYHYIKMNASTTHGYDSILTNIEKIVVQAPYQCHPCRFYAHTEKTFLMHWDSKFHKEIIASKDGKFWCSFCKFQCTENSEMRSHLTGEQHQRLISVMNKNVPITIRKNICIQCHICGKEFRYNVSLNHHMPKCQEENEANTNKEETDSIIAKAYHQQMLFKCSICQDSLKSRSALHLHEAKNHNKFTFFCGVCDLTFETSQEAKKHRTTNEHKIVSAKIKDDPQKLARNCRHCGIEVADTIKLKEHLREFHPLNQYQCVYCGESFIHFQELSTHKRVKRCHLTLTRKVAKTSVQTSDMANQINNEEWIDQSRLDHLMNESDCNAKETLNCTEIIEQNNEQQRSLENYDVADGAAATTTVLAAYDVIANDDVVDDADDSSAGNIATADENTAIVVVIKSNPTETPEHRSSIASHDHHGIDNNTEAIAVVATAAAAAAPSPPSAAGKLTSSAGKQCSERTTEANNISDEAHCVFIDENGQSFTAGDSEKAWVCTECPFTTQSQACFIFHKLLHNDDMVNISSTLKIKCPLCVKSFVKSSLMYHLRQHTNEKPYRCDMCDSSFVRSSNYSEHLRNVHHKPKKDGTVAATKRRKKTEVATADMTLYPCEICQKSFKSSFLLKQHLFVHRDRLAPVKNGCTMSGCRFIARTSSELRYHLLGHSTEKNYACTEPNCTYKAKTPMQLKRHVLTNHSTTEMKSYACTQCEAKFKKSSHLRRHLIQHTGNRPYKCPHCKYSANDSENLRKHVLKTKKHRGKVLYECKLCVDAGKEFGTNFYRLYTDHLFDCHQKTI